MLEPISNDDELYRRIARDFIKPDGSVSSKAFYFKGKPDPHISVDLGRLTTKQDSINRARKPGCRLGILTAGDPRSYGFVVRHDPDVQNNNFSHSLIEGENTKELCYKLAESTKLSSFISS